MIPPNQRIPSVCHYIITLWHQYVRQHYRLTHLLDYDYLISCDYYIMQYVGVSFRFDKSLGEYNIFVKYMIDAKPLIPSLLATNNPHEQCYGTRLVLLPFHL